MVVPGETDSQLLTLMIDRFDTRGRPLGLTAGSAALGLTPYQVITVASIVEKEGVIAKNLGPVARVILNRLHKDMPLQMDSTVLYAEGRDGGPVTATDLQLQTPYNTYLNKGLTPTPICFPSRAALQAALHPPAGSWLYFVVVGQDGTEAFADTFAQQLANEALAKRAAWPERTRLMTRCRRAPIAPEWSGPDEIARDCTYEPDAPRSAPPAGCRLPPPWSA